MRRFSLLWWQRLEPLDRTIDLTTPAACASHPAVGSARIAASMSSNSSSRSSSHSVKMSNGTRLVRTTSSVTPTAKPSVSAEPEASRPLSMLGSMYPSEPYLCGNEGRWPARMAVECLC